MAPARDVWPQPKWAPESNLKKQKFKKCKKIEIFEVVLKAYEAWENAGPIGNVYSFAHAKYGPSTYEQILFRDQNIFPNFISFYFLGHSAPAERPWMPCRW